MILATARMFLRQVYLIIENFTFVQELLLFSETHLLVDAIGPHVRVVEAALWVHVLGHDGHPVSQALGPAPRTSHASPGSAPGLGVAPTSECRLLQCTM